MTETKKKKRERNPFRPPFTRQRGVPVQFYLSESEKGDLQAIARQRKMTITAVLRGWISRSRPKKRRAAKPDPRQRTIFERSSANG